MLPPTAQQDLWMGRMAVEMSLGGIGGMNNHLLECTLFALLVVTGV